MNLKAAGMGTCLALSLAAGAAKAQPASLPCPLTAAEAQAFTTTLSEVSRERYEWGGTRVDYRPHDTPVLGQLPTKIEVWIANNGALQNLIFYIPGRQEDYNAIWREVTGLSCSTTGSCRGVYPEPWAKGSLGAMTVHGNPGMVTLSCDYGVRD